MRKPQSVSTLEALGMVRLSKNFYMREFLYSETAIMHNIQNIPDDPDLAIEVGKRLCEELLEPLNSTFGRVAIRSSYRSRDVNKCCNECGEDCADNVKNRAIHIWDWPDDEGKGATACIVLPWFADKYVQGADWRALAYWIHDHLPSYSELEFFSANCAFNIGWHEKPKKIITSHIKPKGKLLDGLHEKSGHEAMYADFPVFKRSFP